MTKKGINISKALKTIVESILFQIIVLFKIHSLFYLLLFVKIFLFVYFFKIFSRCIWTFSTLISLFMFYKSLFLFMFLISFEEINMKIIRQKTWTRNKRKWENRVVSWMKSKCSSGRHFLLLNFKTKKKIQPQNK